MDTTNNDVSHGFLRGRTWNRPLSGHKCQGPCDSDAKKGAMNSAYPSTVKLQLQDIDYAAANTLVCFGQAPVGSNISLLR